MDYQILADVAGDIDPGIIEKYGIGLLPMEYTLHGENRVCREMESREQLKAFYDGQRAGDLTQTTQITPNQYEEYFEPYLKEGTPVLYLALSSGLSSTYQSACLAAEELGEKYPDVPVVPFDTRSATCGIGMLAERAVRNRAAGMSISENAADLAEARRHQQLLFLVQDLDYLHRGGRVSTAEAVLGSALSVRPILAINDEGKLVIFEKKRGTKQALKTIFDEFEKNYNEDPADPVFVLDSDAPEAAEILKKNILGKYPDIVIREMCLSPIIGAHTGPNLAAIVWMGK